MSGHSKWSTIKRQKGINDAKRGQIFTKLANAITVAVREGGGSDTAANFKLRLAIEKARSVNMPRDNVERAIDRGAGKGGGVTLESVTYEGFGPLGIAIVVQAVTDNKNRTTPLVKSTFDKHGGTMGVPGSVAWQFDSRGIITIPLNSQSEDDVMLQVIDAGADDVESSGGTVEVYTKPEDLNTVKDQLTAQGLPVESAEMILKPKTQVQITSEADAQKVINFIEYLEDLDDVTEVFTNADISV